MERSPIRHMTVDSAVPGASSAVGRRVAIGFTVCVAAALIIAASFLGAYGSASRWDQPKSPVLLQVDTSSQFLDRLQHAGVRDAILITATGQLGYQVVPFGEMLVPDAYPFPIFDIQGAYAKHVRRDNMLWIAAHDGLFRTLHYVIPPDRLAQLVEQGRAAGRAGIAADGSSITANNNGEVRCISSAFPRAGGPVVFAIDASYFETGEPRGLATLLRDSGADVRLMVLNRAIDDTSTTQAARIRLDEFRGIVGDRR